MQFESIWRKRAGKFWQESLPYLRYMAMSGVPLVAALTFFTGVIFYTTFIHEVPEHFPFTLVGTIVMLPIVCWSPLRTWLSEADVVFLVPKENDMGRYLRKSFRYNAIPGAIAAALVFLVYSLLYVQGPGQLPWQAMLAAVVIAKLINTAGAWQERRLVWSRTRGWLRLLRWTVTAICIAALMQSPPWLAALLSVAAIGLMTLLYRSLARHQVPWLLLIRQEAHTRRRYSIFFSAFTDVPTAGAQVSARRYLMWIVRRLSYRQEHAFLFLYAHTLIRTELGGILLRLLALGLFSGWLAAESGLWMGWGAAGVQVFFVWLTGLQLASLTQAHRYSVWRHVYPLPEQSRLQAVLRIDRFASLICALILWLPQLIMLPWQEEKLAPFVAIVLAVIYILTFRPRSLKRKFAADLEED